MTNLSWVLKLPALLMDSMSDCRVSHAVTSCGAISLAAQLVWLPCGPELACARCWLPWARMVAPCVTLSCHALYDPQEEDSVPPRPPLPQSYEPNPPTVPPLPSRAGIRPPSLHRPEDRKANSRNGTHSVSSLTRWPHWLTLPIAVSSHVIAWVKVFTFISMDISCLDELVHAPLFTWSHSSVIGIFQLDEASPAYLFFSFELNCLVFLFCVSLWTSASSVLFCSVLGCKLNHVWV